MRCDGNISLRRRGTEKFGTRCEMKNLNSFKNLHDALEYEIRRQAEVLEEGGVVYQETRHWDVNARRTIVMRTKETADDYRLFPEPDMVPFDLSDEFVDEVRTRLPELPDQRRDRYVEAYGLKRADAAQLAGDPKLAAFFDEAVAGTQGKLTQTVANVILNELMGYLNGQGHGIADTSITPAQVRSLAELLSSDAISSNQGREVFALMAESGDDPAHIVDERGMRQVSAQGRQLQGRGLSRGPVHEGEQGQGQPQAFQPAALRKARRLARAASRRLHLRYDAAVYAPTVCAARAASPIERMRHGRRADQRRRVRGRGQHHHP